MRYPESHIRIWNFTIACSWNRSLKQFIFWIGKREFPYLSDGYGFLDIKIGNFRYPKFKKTSKQ